MFGWPLVCIVTCMTVADCCEVSLRTRVDVGIRIHIIKPIDQHKSLFTIIFIYYTCKLHKLDDDTTKLNRMTCTMTKLN